MAIASARIGVIDDDAAVLDSLRVLLETVGYSVALYHSALAFLDAGTPRDLDCLLLDVRMPRMNGLQLLRHLAYEEWPAPVILMTGHSDSAVSPEGTRDAAYCTLAKPVAPSALLDAIEGARSQLGRTG